MTYQFESEIAKHYGIPEAVFLQNIAYWVAYNKANNMHCYEGKYWTYNTVQSYAELFPFWTYEQVRRIIKNLKANGLLLTGNFNKNSRDRTQWYTLTDKAEMLCKKGVQPNNNATVKNHKCNSEKPQMQLGKTTNATVKNHSSYIGANNKTQIENTDSARALVFLKTNVPTQLEAFKMQYASEIKDFKKFCADFEDTVTIEGLAYNHQVLLARLRKYARNWVANQTKPHMRVVTEDNTKQLYGDAI